MIKADFFYYLKEEVHEQREEEMIPPSRILLRMNQVRDIPGKKKSN